MMCMSHAVALELNSKCKKAHYQKAFDAAKCTRAQAYKAKASI